MQVRLWSQEIHVQLPLASLNFQSIWCGFRYGFNFVTVMIYASCTPNKQTFSSMVLALALAIFLYAFSWVDAGSSWHIWLQGELLQGGEPAGDHSPVLVVGFDFFCIFFPPPLANLPKPAHPGVRWLQGCEATHFSNTSQIESQPHGDASCWPNSNISVVSSIPVLIFLYPVS